MIDNKETREQKKNKGTPFANGLFFGVFLGIVVAIIITLLVTSGKSPFESKKTEGSCIEVNSALGDEDVINIDEDTSRNENSNWIFVPAIGIFVPGCSFVNYNLYEIVEPHDSE